MEQPRETPSSSSIFAKVGRTETRKPQSCASDASEEASKAGARNPLNNMETGANARGPGQRRASLPHRPVSTHLLPLPVQRVRSTIPMADVRPGHQEGNAGKTWVYPSEQMFYNAMKRKGWSPDERDMKSVVAIHNTVNERAWQQILLWEALHAGSNPAGPRLVKFLGRPTDFSPRARMLNFLGYKLPFDRHDWVVDRNGTHVRYVIDFYNGIPAAGIPIAMHLDVRPALDSPQALWDRIRMQGHQIARMSGFAGGHQAQGAAAAAAGVGAGGGGRWEGAGSSGDGEGKK